MGTYTPVSGYSSVSYASSLIPVHGVEKGCFYTPDETRWTKPPKGWPCAICPNYGGFAVSYLALTMSPDSGQGTNFEWLMTFLLDNGIAVYNFAALPVYSDDAGFAIGPPPPTVGNPVDLTWNAGTASATAYGNAPYGNATFIPFECGTPPDYSGSKAYGHPMSDPHRSNAFRDAAMVMQYLWFNAGTMGIDRGNLIDCGGSAAADILAYSSWGPDRASLWFPGAAAGTVNAAPTRVTKASIFNVWQPWYRLFIAPCPIIWAPRTVALGGTKLYDTASIDVSESNKEHLRLGSFLSYALDAGVVIANRKKRLHMLFTDADGSGAPFTTAHVDGETNPHSSWGLSAVIDDAAFPSNAVGYMGTHLTNTQNDGILPTQNPAGQQLKETGTWYLNILSWLDNTVGITRMPKRSKWRLH